MASLFVMPQLGLDMKEGTVQRWLKQEGDPVSRGEVIVEIETEKATVEVEAPASGVLRKIVVPEGDTVPVGQLIAVIAAPEEEIAQDIEGQFTEAPPAAEPAAISEESPASATPDRIAPGARVRASPRSRKLAEEHGVELSLVKGTGPGGRIVQEDVEEYLRRKQGDDGQARAPAEERAETPATPSRMRQAIARRMAQSKQEIPHFYVSMVVDMSDALRLRAQFNETVASEAKVSVNDLVLKAAAIALQRFPHFNAWYVDGQVQPKEQINIGIAIALPDGLVAPAILDCGNKGLLQIAADSRDLISRANSGMLRSEEYAGATFTVSNLGMHGADSFIAIVNPPQVSILALGAVSKEPVVRDNQVVIADVMKMVLSSDHRVLDGAAAAEFLADVKTSLEMPWKLTQGS